MTGAIWNLPGPSRFLGRAVRSLCEGKHLVLVVPDPVLQDGLLQELRRWICREKALEGDLRTVKVGPDIHPRPQEALASAIGARSGSLKALTLSRLLDFEDAPAAFLALEGLENGDPERNNEASRLLKVAGEHAQDQPPAYQIVAPVSPEFPVPQENVKLSTLFWQGVSRKADIHYILETELDSLGLTPGHSAWLRALCLGLAPGYPEVAHAILAQRPSTVQDVHDLLKKMADGAEHITLPSGLLPALAKERITPGVLPKDQQVRTWWRKGWVGWADGPTPRVAPVALAAAGAFDVIDHRILQGQLEVLLPMVEQVRRDMIAWLTHRFGPEWIDTEIPGLDPDERRRVETEIGPLVHHVCRAPNWKLRKGVPHVLRKMGDCWVTIRNKLVHGDLVHLPDLEEGVVAIERFRRVG